MENNRIHNINFPNKRVQVVLADAADTLALSDWCDMHLGRDFFFRRRHMEQILKRSGNQTFAILVDDVMAGLVILYAGSILHNFYLSEEHRHVGLGSAILQHFMPTRIRSKTNMLAGDPTPFYERNGYRIETADPARPHIIDMVRPNALPGEAVGETAEHNSRAELFHNAQPQPGGALGLSNGNMSELERQELESLRKKEQNRERARNYRLMKKQQDADRAAAVVRARA
jgi:GNAT superfamily N-acetyltransferase